MTIHRRGFLKSAAAGAIAALTPRATADNPPFTPVPGHWRKFELTTRVEILKPQGSVRAWIPVPAFESREWIQLAGGHGHSDNATISVRSGGPYGEKAACIEWPGNATTFVAEIQ